MKPYYLKNAGEYHSRLTTKLAVLLLALPALGAFAGDKVEVYDVSTGLDLSSTPAAIGITTSTDGTTGTGAVASIFNPSSLTNGSDGLQTVVFQNATNYYVLSGASYLASNSGTIGDLTIGSVAAAPVNFTVKGSVDFYAGNVTVGSHTMKDSNVSALGDGNTVTIQDALVSGTGTLAPSGAGFTSLTFGEFGSKNALSVKNGADLALLADLTVGLGSKDAAAYGSNNSVAVAGTVSITTTSGVKTVKSTLAVTGNAFIGSYGSGNSLSVADSGVVTVGGNLSLGVTGGSNTVTVSSGSIAVTGSTKLGANAASTGNAINVASSYSTSGLTIGEFGSSNAVAVTGGTFTAAGGVVIGMGDSTTADCNADGTKGFAASEGSSNSLTLSSGALLKTAVIDVGVTGSSNVLTVSGGSIVDSADPTRNSDKVVTATTGIGSLTIGYGSIANSSYDVTAAGDNNTATVTGANSILAVSGSIMVGPYGSGNKLVVSSGAYLGKSVSLASGSITDGPNLLIGLGADSVLSAKDDTKIANGNSASVDASKAVFSAIVVGDCGSNNSMSISGGSYVTANYLALGELAKAGDPGILVSTILPSRGNSVLVDGAKTMFVVSGGGVTVGDMGINNTITVQNGANMWVKNSGIVIGVGDSDSYKFGDSNSVVVTGANSVLKSDEGFVIGDSSYSASYNTLVVSDGAVVVVDEATTIGGTDYFIYANPNGDGNAIELDGGYIAIKGKLGAANQNGSIDNLYEQIYGDTVSSTSSVKVDGLLDNGQIKVMKNGSFVKATASDISVVYYDSDAAAAAATGYEGLAGYTIISQGAGSTRDLSWAGSKLYDNKDGWYCSTWYGWFYSTEATGNFIMSGADYSWQYVDPSSTPSAAYFYDYSLGSWIYTDSAHFQKNWVYEYKTSSWIQLGK